MWATSFNFFVIFHVYRGKRGQQEITYVSDFQNSTINPRVRINRVNSLTVTESPRQIDEIFGNTELRKNSTSNVKMFREIEFE